ncbi:hypothetical protein [Blastococcus sp. Marseille-P5729]|uniref:hypothetical protein n=1 Tax=Blastococcus sp. Marseille-P5729 TaxID=2086582 RepID=UPI000D0EA6EA|nr:hypothetical protein [Blastococcus sp. Marseille-P5729]
MSSARPLPTVIGPTENALRALLTRTLSSTLIPSYPAWVVLNAASAADSSNDWRQRAADGLKADADEIDGVLAELRTAGLVDDDGTLTAAGAAELTTARAAVTGTTLRLIEGIDETEQETARRVLDAIRQKAEGLLGA